jgi:Cu2+-exporting ATPase
MRRQINASGSPVKAGVGGGFAFDEVLREGAQAMLALLQAEGVRLTLVTGDSPRARTPWRAAWIWTKCWPQATPQDKLDAVARAQAAGSRVVMVGDGVNDAPVLARADASLAMGQGALVSRSHADAVITSNRLASDLVGARRTAQAAMRIVRQNLVWAGPTTRPASRWPWWAGCRPGRPAWAWRRVPGGGAQRTACRPLKGPPWKSCGC